MTAAPPCSFCGATAVRRGRIAGSDSDFVPLCNNDRCADRLSTHANTHTHIGAPQPTGSPDNGDNSRPYRYVPVYIVALGMMGASGTVPGLRPVAPLVGYAGSALWTTAMAHQLFAHMGNADSCPYHIIFGSNNAQLPAVYQLQSTPSAADDSPRGRLNS